MEKNEKPLPRPPKTPFGRKRRSEDEEGQDLLADRMAEAAALGNLEALLNEELPDSEHARALANMMMGMTGMLPQGAGPSPARQEQAPQEPPETPAGEAPSGLREAVQAGDVRGLIAMLRQEHQKRTGSGDAPPAQEEGQASEQEGLQPQEREVLDRMIALAREQNVSPDWIILRALKLYLEEYRRTGRL